MAFLIGGANSAADTGYNIENSLRFNQASSHFLSTTFGSAGNQKTFTISTWCKLGNLATSDEISIMGAGGTSGGNPRSYFQFAAGDLFLRIADNASGSAWKRIITSSRYRDPSAWYHVVATVDTTQGTEADRMKLYVNGTQITALGTEAYPDQNADLNWNDDVNHYVGAYPNNANYDYEGYLADFYFIDGTAYAASAFGETDEDSGIWKPKDAKDDLTFGSNGFFLEFKQSGTDTDASGLGADTSGNDTHFASNNLAATDQCPDTPTNNFATLNPLHNFQNDPVYSEGNTKVVFADGGNGASPLSTIALNDGKWYFEAKFVQTSDPGHGAIGVGIVDADQFNVDAQADEFFDRYDYGYSYTTDGEKKTNNSGSSFGDEYNSGDIIGVAVDFDNRQIYFSLNGTFQDSGDPTSGATGTGSAHNFSSAYYYMSVYAYQDENSWEVNFGNPPFSISSGNADANGYGNFEYAVPSGYYAICSKNLAKYG